MTKKIVDPNTVKYKFEIGDQVYFLKDSGVSTGVINKRSNSQDSERNITEYAIGVDSGGNIHINEENLFIDAEALGQAISYDGFGADNPIVKDWKNNRD